MADCLLVSEEQPCIVNVVCWHHTVNFFIIRVAVQQKRACAYPRHVSQQLSNDGSCQYTHTVPQELLRINAFRFHLTTMAVKNKLIRRSTTRCCRFLSGMKISNTWEHTPLEKQTFPQLAKIP